MALRCGTLSYLTLAHLWIGQLEAAERTALQVVELAGGDPHLGADVAGFSPLLAARFSHARAIGLGRDPAAALREFPIVRQLALDSGYPEQALWTLSGESELRSTLGRSEGTRALAQTAARLAEDFEAGGQIIAGLALCDALASEREWQSLVDAGSDTLQRIRTRRAMVLYEVNLLTLIGTAQLELGGPEASRTSAAAAIAFMRESHAAWRPNAHAVLARAQLELREPAADIASTLDEYAALLERTGFAIFEGELHELRARLEEREGRRAERSAALKRAGTCYTRFGMADQAARVAEMVE